MDCPWKDMFGTLAWKYQMNIPAAEHKHRIVADTFD